MMVVIRALAQADVKDKLNRLGAEPMPMTPEAFNAFIKVEMDSAAKIAKAAGLKGS
jgi:tripartite-type tricarboxylate transporter receptor subunit TctC